jgi:hypothetical protein
MEDATEFLEFVRIAPFQISAVDFRLRMNISFLSFFKFLRGGTDGIQINLLLSK